MTAVAHAFRRQCRNQLLTQRFAVGVAEVDMGDVLQVIGKVGVLTTAGVVDQLMRHAEMPGAHGGMDAAHGVDRQNGFGTGLLQRPEVGAVVDLMRWKTMGMTVTREEQYFLAGILADLNVGRRCAIRRVHCQ
ncbi:hypothetical protein D3C78_1135090 [compost metagenome]